MATNSPIPLQSEPNPNPNPNLTPSPFIEDTEELKKVFNRFDANGDGKISVEEIDTILRTLGSGVPQEELQRAVKDLDTDQDGFINPSEFAAFCRSDSPDGGDVELRDAFDLYDIDKNSLISVDELHLALNRLGMKCSVDECRDMIKSVDSDGDGSVDFREFKLMMTHKNHVVNDSVNDSVELK